ncbi:MAG: hypothetical protein LBO09_01115 [Candidatus Peribacteria bacterium]|nr:hypothetical protein [Candidatus Peribacteria bacterium]
METPATPEVVDFSLEAPLSPATDTPTPVSDDFSLDLGTDAFAPTTPLTEGVPLLPDTSEPSIESSEPTLEPTEQAITELTMTEPEAPEQIISEPTLDLSEPVANEESTNDFSLNLEADAFAPAIPLTEDSAPLTEEITPLSEEPIEQVEQVEPTEPAIPEPEAPEQTISEPTLDLSEPVANEEATNDFSLNLEADTFAPAIPLTPSISDSLENPESFAPISTPDTPPVDFSEPTTNEPLVNEIPANETPASEITPPSPDYQPTPDAFNQTIDALNTAKAEGTTFMSSEDFPSITPETEATQEEKVLNLDQMVAKFNGEEIPADPVDDPFAPMKKALEEEERKALEEKGVDVNGVPLVLNPEIEEKAPATSPELSDMNAETPSTPGELDDPVVSEEVADPEPIAEQPALVENTPETAGTLSLDDIIDTGAVAIPPTPQPSVEISTGMDFSGILEKLKKNPMVLAGAGGLVILIFVLVTMFPSGSASPAEITLPENTQPQIPDPDHNSAVETPSNSEGISLLPDSSEEPTTTLPAEYPEDNFSPVDPGSISTDPQPWDGYDEPEDPTPTVEISAQDMAQNLVSQYNLAQQLVGVGESEDDAYLVKYAGYIVYQSDLLIKRLENGETLDIDYYTMLSNRMNGFLSQMQSYLNGEFDPNLPQNPQTPTDSEQEKQQLQDFVYSQN